MTKKNNIIIQNWFAPVSYTHLAINKTFHNEQQCQKSYVNNTSGKSVYIASGLYSEDIKDELKYSKYVNDYVEHVRHKSDNDTVVGTKINGCVSNILFDTGAQISLISKEFIDEHTPILKNSDLTCQRCNCHNSYRLSLIHI